MTTIRVCPKETDAMSQRARFGTRKTLSASESVGATIQIMVRFRGSIANAITS